MLVAVEAKKEKILYRMSSQFPLSFRFVVQKQSPATARRTIKAHPALIINMLTIQATVPIKERAIGVLKRGRQLGFLRRVSKKATKLRRP